MFKNKCGRIKVDLDYCKKLAWSGTSDSKGYKLLSYIEQEEIYNVVAVERGNHTTQSLFEIRGKPCP